MSAASRIKDPGELNLRMQVLQPNKTSDGMGGASVTFAIQRSAWAKFDTDAPVVTSTSPIEDTAERGTVRMALGLAPPVGWRLAWMALGGQRTVEVDAVQRGSASDPFDLCLVHELTGESET